MKNKISLVSNYALNEPVLRNRLFPFINEFQSEGYDVNLICPKSDCNKSLMPEKTKLFEVDIETNKPRNFVRRALKELSEARQLLRIVAQTETKIVLVTIPSMFLAFLAPFYLKNKEVFLDVRDLSWEYLPESSLVSKFSKIMLRFFFKKTVCFFRYVSVTNDTELNYVKKINYKVKNVALVSNGISQEQFNKLQELPAANNTHFTVTYIGNLGLAQQLDSLFYAAQKLPHINFYVVGGGNDEIRLKNLLEELKLTNVVMTGRVSWDQVIYHYAQSSVLYAQLTPDYSGAMPSKLYEYLATGKWVVYGGVGQAPEILKYFEGCSVIQPCSAEALVKAIEKIEKELPMNYVSTNNIRKIKDRYIREDSIRSYIENLKKANVL